MNEDRRKTLHVVGLPYHEYYKYSESLDDESKIVLKREKENTHDKNAIEVFLDTSPGPQVDITKLVKLGYIKHNQAKEFGPYMDENKITYQMAYYQKVKKLVTDKEIMIINLDLNNIIVSGLKKTKGPKASTRKRINVWI